MMKIEKWQRYLKILANAANPWCSVVIAAAGSSSRMGTDKIWIDLAGKPVIAHTLQAYQNCQRVHEIVIVSRTQDAERLQALAQQEHITKLTSLVPGGCNRCESSYNGTMACSKKAKLIAVADAVRPFVRPEAIDQVIHTATHCGAAILAVPVKDTIKVAENNYIQETPNRTTLFQAQTPQVFEANLLKAALSNAIENQLDITDDSSAVEALGMQVMIVPGDYHNIKITTPDDLILANTIWEKQK